MAKAGGALFRERGGKIFKISGNGGYFSNAVEFFFLGGGGKLLE